MIVIVTDSDSWSFVSSQSVLALLVSVLVILSPGRIFWGIMPLEEGPVQASGYNEQHFVPDMNITANWCKPFNKASLVNIAVIPSVLVKDDDAMASSLDGRWVRSGKNIHVDNLCINEHQFCYLYPISQGLIGW